MIAVYTALFGPYDTVQPAIWPNSYLFTDQDIKPDGWQVIKVEPWKDNRYASRYYFSQSYEVMHQFRYTVLHGANAQLKVDPDILIPYLGKNDWACCAHPRGNVYEEARAVIRMHKDNPIVVDAQMDRYRQDGFNGSDLSALIIVVRRNTARLREFEYILWDEIQTGSYRDQLAFDYCRWKHRFPISRLPNHWTHYLHLQRHK